MTFEEFKTTVKEDFMSEISMIDIEDENERERLLGRRDGIIFAAECFLPIRYHAELSQLRSELRKMMRVKK